MPHHFDDYHEAHSQGEKLMSDHLIEVAWYWFAAFLTLTAMAVAILRSTDHA